MGTANGQSHLKFGHGNIILILKNCSGTDEVFDCDESLSLPGNVGIENMISLAIMLYLMETPLRSSLSSGVFGN